MARRYTVWWLYVGRVATGRLNRSRASTRSIFGVQHAERAVVIWHRIEYWAAAGAVLAGSCRRGTRRHVYARPTRLDRWNGGRQACPCRRLVHQFVHPRLVAFLPTRPGWLAMGLAWCIHGEWCTRHRWRAACLERDATHEHWNRHRTGPLDARCPAGIQQSRRARFDRRVHGDDLGDRRAAAMDRGVLG